jgi:glycosyltransferase involved in cell wall biosynthesis
MGHHADLIVANSEAGAAYWKSVGVPASRIAVIPNFVAREEIERAEPLDDPRVSADDELVLHVGRLSPDKNLRVLIAAFEEVCRKRPRAKLALCGVGPWQDLLMEQVRRSDLESRVVFAGFVRNIPSWLKRADVVVAISEAEGHPNAVIEAIAAGAPIVLSAIPSHQAIVDDGGAAFVPFDDVRAVAHAIDETLQDRSAALQRAARAKSTVAELTLDAAVRQYRDAYRRAIAGRRKGID